MGRSSGSGFYDDVIKLLGEITGLQWGYYKPSRRVQYVSSVEIPVKIGAIWGKNYEKNCKPLDIEIIHKYKKIFDGNGWADAAGSELKRKLLAHAPIQYIAKISSWKPSSKYIEARAYAEDQRKKWGAPSETGAMYNRYYDEIINRRS